jgi:putative oxidoreductase
MTTTNKVVYYVLLVLVSALFLFAAYPKLIADPMAVAGFTQSHLPVWFMYFIGVVEVLGVIGLWIRKTQKSAIWGLMIIMAGAVITTAIFQTVTMAILPLVVGIALYGINCLAKKRGMMAPAAPAPTATV